MTVLTASRILECAVPVERGVKGNRRSCRMGAGMPAAPLPAGRLPRVARLLALAHRFDGLVRQGLIADYAALARLGHVSRAHITQILNLLYLAPDIQEQILFLPLTVRGRDPLHLRQLQPLTQILDWGLQRARWRQLQTD